VPLRVETGKSIGGTRPLTHYLTAMNQSQGYLVSVTCIKEWYNKTEGRKLSGWEPLYTAVCVTHRRLCSCGHRSGSRGSGVLAGKCCCQAGRIVVHEVRHKISGPRRGIVDSAFPCRLLPGVTFLPAPGTPAFRVAGRQHFYVPDAVRLRCL
jgi:hypothetical protein